MGFKSLELPPRTRRIPVTFDRVCYLSGTTSAHAENTCRKTGAKSALRNYLRARGEYRLPARGWVPPWELPPRTRRIPVDCPRRFLPLGTTSAHAENTALHTGIVVAYRNYLRARGEYNDMLNATEVVPELPPRTRRIQHPRHGGAFYDGTTSAHAENTRQARRGTHRTWNYLRARGEYNGVQAASFQRKELPPRTRRILASGLVFGCCNGTTSAHAENTILNVMIHLTLGNYLRARGEYIKEAAQGLSEPELPPRTRRIHRCAASVCVIMGTTSAHAENTCGRTGGCCGSWNYLRARGEYPK